jgi:tetratricopeptide (TPR) repeat protein
VAALFDAGEKMNAILVRYKAQTPPPDTDVDNWKSSHDRALADQHDQIEYVYALLITAVYHAQSPADRAALGERFGADFPDSSYAASAEGIAASAYQQLQNYPKMIAVGEKAHSLDPNNTDVLLLLADSYTENGQELDKADSYAKKAIALLGAAKKPDNVSADDWQKRINFQTGLAWSAEGQVLIIQNDLAGAASAFQKASPLLKGNTVYYARTLYRLGFTSARMKKIPEATAALNEAASLDSPFKARALQTLQQLNGTAPPPRRTSH